MNELWPVPPARSGSRRYTTFRVDELRWRKENLYHMYTTGACIHNGVHYDILTQRQMRKTSSTSFWDFFGW